MGTHNNAHPLTGELLAKKKTLPWQNTDRENLHTRSPGHPLKEKQEEINPSLWQQNTKVKERQARICHLD